MYLLEFLQIINEYYERRSSKRLFGGKMHHVHNGHGIHYRWCRDETGKEKLLQEILVMSLAWTSHHCVSFLQVFSCFLLSLTPSFLSYIQYDDELVATILPRYFFSLWLKIKICRGISLWENLRSLDF